MKNTQGCFFYPPLRCIWGMEELLPINFSSNALRGFKVLRRKRRNFCCILPSDRKCFSIFVSDMKEQWNIASPYTFSAKEKDSESGYNYFGARYYSDGMMQWLSVDPMSDMRPGVSPYSYCQNNPIGRIDPSGALDGDYYTFKGKYLGKDGKDDHNVFFVKNDDKNSIRTIKSNNRKGLTTQSSDVNVAVSTNQETLKETLDVFYRTWENSGGNREEASVVSPDGSKILRGETGTEGRTKLPSMEGNDNTSIHSHAYGDYTDHDGSYWYTPSEPSKKDEATFMHNRLNIIVGLEKPDNDGNRISKANFYNRKTESLGSMEINRIKKVLK